MKTNKKPTSLRCIIQGLLTLSLSIGSSQAATYQKANTSTMNLTTDWASGIVPTSTDTASWQTGTVSLANNLAMTLGGSFSCLNMDIRSSGQTPANNCLVINSDGNTLSLFSNSSGNDAGAISLVQTPMAVAINCPVTLSQASGGAFFRIINASLSVGGSIGQTTSGLTLNKQGGGALNLSAANSYTGATTVQSGGGILTLSGSGTLGSPGTGGVTMTSSTGGGTLDLGGTSQTVGGIVTFGKCEVRNGTLINNSASTGGSSAFVKGGIVSANLQGTGNLYLDDNTHFLKLSGTNTYSGTTIVQGGLLVASKPAALPNSGASGTITLNNNSANANLVVRAGAALGEWATGDIDGLMANPNFTCAGTAFFGIDTTGGDFSYGTAIPNKINMALKKLGPNKLTLTAANLYPGVTQISRGTLKVDNGSGGSLATSSGLTFIGTGTFNYETASTSQSLGALNFSVGDGTVQLTRSADAALTFSSLATRTAGATGNLTLSAGTPSATNGFNLTGAAAGFINQGTFFSGADFAYMDAVGTFVRAPGYGTDSGFEAADTITASTHVKLTSTPAAQPSITLNTLNLAGSGVGFPQSGTLTLVNNGILKSGGGSVGTISGGSIFLSNSASNKELVIRTDSSSDSLTISSAIGAGLTPTGTITSSTAAITGLSSTTGLVPGMTFRSSGGTSRTILTVDSATQVTLSGTAGGTSGSQQMWFGYVADGVTKSGAGTLTLSGNNMFGGGVFLDGGQLNINSPTALGGGINFTGQGATIGRFTINEGTTIDNTSGAPLSLTYKYALTWNGSFTFVGSNDLFLPDPSGNGNITMPNDITVTTSTAGTTLRTQSNFTLTVARLTKDGPGTLQIGSNGGNGINGGLAINEGVFAGYWAAGGQPFQVFAGPVDLGDTTPSNTKDAILNIDQNSQHSAPITARAGSTGTLAILGQNTQILSGPIQLNNALTIACSGSEIRLFGVISGSGNLNIGKAGAALPFTVFGTVKGLTNTGSVTMWRDNNYTGDTLVNSGTLKLGAQAKIDSSPVISLAAGTSLDVSQIAAFTLSGTNTLTARGTGTTTGTTAARINGASGGTVSMSDRPISLDFAPTGFAGDTTHPSLLISQGTLALSSNVISVNNTSGTPLGEGVYRLIQASATTTGTPASAVTVTGSGLAPYSTATASVDGNGHVILTVDTKLPPTLTSLPLSQTVQLSAGTVTLSGLVSAAGPTYPADGETVQITINGSTQNATIAGGAGAFTINYSPLPAVGVYPITYSYAGNVDLWTASDVTTTLTVTNLTVPTITTWPSATGITYGQTLTSSGLSGGSASVTGTFTFTTSSTMPSAGTYAASGTFTPDDTVNYSTLVVPGAISVEVAQKTLTLTSSAVTARPYNGTTAAAITGTLDGVLAGDIGLVTLVGTGTYQTPAPAPGTGIAVDAACTLSGSKAGNYTLTQPSGLSGDITAALLTVTANDASRAAGAANPTFTYTITGYQNGENAGSAGVTGSPILTTLADNLSPEGTYAISCALNDLAAPSYTFTPVDGILTVISSLNWAAGNGVWDIDTSLNWKNSGGTAVRYTDGVPTLFDNTATGGSPFTVTLGTTVNPGAITVSATNKNYTISGTGNIAGTASVTKNGAGTLKMATNNSYNGGTTVSTGTLSVGHQNGLGTGLVSLAAGTTFQQLDFEGNIVTGALPNAFDLTGTGNVTMQISFGQKDIWLSQPVTGTGGMTVQGGVRALTLTAENSFGGGIKLTNNNNRVVIASLTALGTGTFRTETTTAGSGTLEAAADLSTSPGVANAIDIASGAYLNVVANNNILLAGPITSVVGTGSLYKAGTATLTLSGTNTYTGTTAVTAGKVLVNGTNSGAGAVTVSSTATLGGTGSIGGNVTYASGALAQFTKGSPLAITGTLTLNSNVVHLVLPTDLGNGTYTLATYNPTGSTGTFDVTPVIHSGSLASGGTATVATSGGTVSLTVVGAASSAYDTWATDKLLTGANNGKSDDPDGDGNNNLYEFAFDGNPLSGVNDGKIVGKIAAVSANQVLTLTLPVRTGATFSVSSGDQLSALIDGIYYRIEGDVDLSTFADGITEVTTGDETTIQAGLPALSTGWTYRTFRAPGTVPVDPKAFLRAKISETP
jgi:autotransporter-associated beta strand protein